MALDERGRRDDETSPSLYWCAGTVQSPGVPNTYSQGRPKNLTRACSIITNPRDITGYAAIDELDLAGPRFQRALPKRWSSAVVGVPRPTPPTEGMIVASFGSTYAGPRHH